MKKSMVVKRIKTKKYLLSGMLFAGILLLSGCGETPFELQENERAVIVNYAAHIVSKYNIKQPEGYRYVYVSEEEEAELAQNQQQEEPQDTQPDSQDEQTNGQEELSQSDDGNDGSAQENGAAQGDGESEQPSVTLTEALGLKHVQAVYTGAELTENYHSVVPEAGKKLLIMHVTLQNLTEKTRKCDILSIFPAFRAKINGAYEVMAELSILPENLATWEESIPAGESVDTVIMFQVKKDAFDSIEQLELNVTVGEQTSRVVFM